MTIRQFISSLFRVDCVNPVVIPDTVRIEREIPDQVYKAYSDRFERFDYKTIFYDVFFSKVSGHIRLSGPPLANLTEYVKASYFLVDGQDVSNHVTLTDRIRKQESSINHAEGQSLTLHCPHFTVTTKISEIDTKTFLDRNVLLVINKDNSLAWLSDWLTFYAAAHRVDSILLYDTGSTAYTSRALLDVLQSVTGIEAAVVVRWPFRHGPFRERPGVDASANYSQVAMLAHAKEKYLSGARSVIHCDVDEIIYSYSGRTLCDAVVEADRGVIMVPGTWIESVTTASAPYRHLDFRHVDPRRDPSFPKWCVAPAKLPAEGDWQVHGIWGLEVEATSQFHFAHFRGISTNWREKRAIYRAPMAEHEIFTEIEEYIAPHLVGKPRYQPAEESAKGIEMAVSSNVEPLERVAVEIKPSLEPAGLAALKEHLSGCESYLEYGCGGSTVLAAQSGVKWIMSVDTARPWLDKVEQETQNFGANITLTHCDLGPVKAWGYPEDKQHIGQFHRYAILPWEAAKAVGTRPQLVFIDGRFRAACFLYSLMAADPGTMILFDDYMNRPSYHEVEKLCRRMGNRGRMGIFMVEENIDRLAISESFAKYSICEF